MTKTSLPYEAGDAFEMKAWATKTSLPDEGSDTFEMKAWVMTKVLVQCRHTVFLACCRFVGECFVTLWVGFRTDIALNG